MMRSRCSRASFFLRFSSVTPSSCVGCGPSNLASTSWILASPSCCSIETHHEKRCSSSFGNCACPLKRSKSWSREQVCYAMRCDANRGRKVSKNLSQQSKKEGKEGTSAGNTSNKRVVAFKVKVPGIIFEWDRAKVMRWRHMSRAVALWLSGALREWLGWQSLKSCAASHKRGSGRESWSAGGSPTKQKGPSGG